MSAYPVDAAEATAFLQHLWPAGIPEGQLLTLWTLIDKNSYQLANFHGSLGYIANVCAGSDAYFHVGLTNKRFRNSRPGIKDVTLLPALWLDLDAKNGVSIAGLRDYIEQCFPSPSIVVATGGGYHLYWLLREPETAARVAPVEEGFIRWHQSCAPFAVDSVYDVSRVMRLPGTWNYKHGEPRFCSVYVKGVKRYDLSDFPVIEAPTIVRPELPDVLGESAGPYDGRDRTLFKLLSAMRRFNCPESWLLTTARAINAEHFSPPMSDATVAQKVRSVLRYAPAKQTAAADIQKWLEGE